MMFLKLVLATITVFALLAACSAVPYAVLLFIGLRPN